MMNLNRKVRQLWRRFKIEYFVRPDNEEMIMAVNRMVDKGMVKRELANNEWLYELTKEGKKFVRDYFGKTKKLKT